MRITILSTGLLVLALAAACGTADTPPAADPGSGAILTERSPAETTAEAEWGTLVVAVTDADGTPQEGVPLAIEGTDGANPAPDWESAPLTGPDGTIEITGLLGEYTAATVLDGAANDSGEAAVEAGATARIDLVVG